MFQSTRIDNIKTSTILFVTLCFVLFMFGFGLIPKVHAFETDSVDIDTMEFSVSADTNENILFHLSMNGEPLTWSFFESQPDMVITIKHSLPFLTYLHNDTEYIARDVQSTKVSDGYVLEISNSMLRSVTSGYEPESLDEPVRFMINGIGRPRTFTGSVSGYKEPPPPKTDLEIAVEESSKMLKEIIMSVLETIVSNPLLLLVYSIAFVALMFWLFSFLRV